MKTFNTVGTCIPKRHYMVDITNKLNQIIDLIDNGKYFIINRARQYGKSTTLYSLGRVLREKYYVIHISFEECADSFTSSQNFCKAFCELAYTSLRESSTSIEESLLSILQEEISNQTPLSNLGDIITELCETSDKPIILLIDDADSNCQNEVFVSFLSLLRSKFLDRQRKMDYTFKSVILASVDEIDNISLRDPIDNSPLPSSPWNIATNFDVDMSFNPQEISTMLIDYEKDYQTGMNIQEISQEIYNYTSGYPYLVSKICDTIHNQLDKDWSLRGVSQAVEIIVNGKNPLFDNIIKVIRESSDLLEMVDDIIFKEVYIPYNYYYEPIRTGVLLGLFLRDESDYSVEISNRIFEIFLKKAIEMNDIPLEYYNDKTIQALLESRRISHDPNTKRYNNFSEVLEELEKEDNDEL